MDIFQWPSETPDLNPTEQLFSYCRLKLMQKDTHKQAAAEGGAFGDVFDDVQGF